MRACLECDEQKPLDAYYKIHGYDTREKVCKRCRNTKREANRKVQMNAETVLKDGFVMDPAAWRFLTRPITQHAE